MPSVAPLRPWRSGAARLARLFCAHTTQEPEPSSRSGSGVGEPQWPLTKFDSAVRPASGLLCRRRCCHARLILVAATVAFERAGRRSKARDADGSAA